MLSANVFGYVLTSSFVMLFGVDALVRVESLPEEIGNVWGDWCQKLQQCGQNLMQSIDCSVALGF